MAGCEWVTQRVAAELLGVHPSLIPKMLRRGDLATRKKRPSLKRAQVLELAETRARVAQERGQRGEQSRPTSPDDEHDWLLAHAAAAVLGCTEIALKGRATRDRVPYVVHGGRRWYRLDQLELQVRAQVARQQQKSRALSAQTSTEG